MDAILENFNKNLTSSLFCSLFESYSLLVLSSFSFCIVGSSSNLFIEIDSAVGGNKWPLTKKKPPSSFRAPSFLYYALFTYTELDVYITKKEFVFLFSSLSLTEMMARSEKCCVNGSSAAAAAASLAIFIEREDDNTRWHVVASHPNREQAD